MSADYLLPGGVIVSGLNLPYRLHTAVIMYLPLRVCQIHTGKHM